MSDTADEEEIVASGEALRTVAGWLGVANVGEVMEKEGLNPEFEQGRTQGLGLGAKFLPHHKAVALTTGVEHRLSSKIKRTQERQAAAGSGGSGGGAAPALHQLHGAAKHRALLQHGRHHAAARRGQDGAAAAQRQGQAAEEEEDSEEEEGRGGAFAKGKAKAAQRPAGFSRNDLLKAGAAVQQGKKRKRKGGGGGGAAGS
ncbi:hypothetical protein COHA_009252 [Chlorella ohadii]|uniref:Uncharacterized protein n=1 Tax=Chlorella ohadii TaxID=2649997 RepID=A0AAD5DF67_9CHLO|nr:hypothetical protein COHA_009252 [Chlorella ohadii]